MKTNETLYLATKFDEIIDVQEDIIETMSDILNYYSNKYGEEKDVQHLLKKIVSLTYKEKQIYCELNNKLHLGYDVEDKFCIPEDKHYLN